MNTPATSEWQYLSAFGNVQFGLNPMHICMASQYKEN